MVAAQFGRGLIARRPGSHPQSAEHGTEVAFEVSTKDLGIELINSALYHPQTLGKLERLHRTLKEWLADEGPAETLEHFQELLDGFRFHYNRRRPHQGIDDATPAEHYGIAPIDPDAIRLPDPDRMTEPTYPPDGYVRKVGATGNIGWRGKLVHVGSRYAAAHVRVVEVNQLVHIYHGDALIRALTIEPNRYYQPKGALPVGVGIVGGVLGWGQGPCHRCGCSWQQHDGGL